MLYQTTFKLTDASIFYLEKNNITKKDINEIISKFKIPPLYSDKAIFIAKLFTNYETKILIDFANENSYIKELTYTKIDPSTLDDHIIPYSKIAKKSDEHGSNWEIISFGQINNMFVSGYGKVKENNNLRKKERNYKASILLLKLINIPTTSKNINTLQDYLINIKKLDDVSIFLNDLLECKENNTEKFYNEISKILSISNFEYSENFKNIEGCISDKKIIKIPTGNWQY